MEKKFTDRQTNIITEKAKTIYPLYTSYRGYNHKAVGYLRNVGMEPLENHKAVGFLRNIGMKPLENYKAVGYLRNIGDGTPWKITKL